MFTYSLFFLASLALVPGHVQGQDRPPRDPPPDGGNRVTCVTGVQYMGETQLIGQGPAAAPLRGNIGCVDLAAHALRDTNVLPVPEDQDAFNIYGPMEAGFRSSNFGGNCIPEGTTVPGGIDTNTAELIVATICPEQNIQVLDACGGHAVPYHYHERMTCLYYADPVTGHSTRIGTAADGNGIYGNHIEGGVEPNDLDGCGGRFGVTPDSNGEVVYYYPITSAPPFSIGCYGPASYEECRMLYPETCGDGATIGTVTTEYGTGQYTYDCPCFDSNHSNVIGQGRPGFLPALASVSPTESPSTAPTGTPTKYPTGSGKKTKKKKKKKHGNNAFRGFKKNGGK